MPYKYKSIATSSTSFWLIFPRFHPSTGLFVPNLMSTRVAAQEPPGGATNPKVNDDRGEDPKGEGRSIASPIFNSTQGIKLKKGYTPED